MYNWITDLENIYSDLESNGFIDLKQKLLDSQLSGGTGWETFLLVTTTLKEFKKEYVDAYKIINREANRIFDYGLKNGLISIETIDNESPT